MRRDPEPPRPPRIALVDYPDALGTAVLGLRDLVAAAGRLSGRPGEAVLLAPADLAADDPAPEDRFDAVILPPAAIGRRPSGEWPELVRFLERQHGAGAVVCSVCAGLHWLARTALVGDRPVTTHWALEGEMRAAFPALRLDTRRMVIEDADMVTAGGMMAWMDLGLVLVARFWGEETADQVARFLVVDPVRPNQGRYRRFLPRRDHGDAAILGVQNHIEARLAGPLSVVALARAAAMSPRTFLRRFTAATGLAPARYLQEARVERARRLLAATRDPVALVGHAVGYGDPAAFARVFRRLAGESPAAFRAAVRSRSGA